MRVVGIAAGVLGAWLAVASWGRPLALVLGFFVLSLVLSFGLVRRGWGLLGWAMFAAAIAGIGVGGLAAAGF
jgi:hypothetical protein